MKKLLYLSQAITSQRLFLKKARIVIEKNNWEPAIRRFSRFLRHELLFEEDLRKIKPEDVDLIIPLTGNWIFEAPDDLRRLMPVPSIAAYRLCENKKRLNDFLVHQAWISIIPRADLGVFPRIVKPCVGGNSTGCVIVANQKEYDSLPKEGEPSFDQEFVLGDREYACHLLTDQEGVLKCLTIEYLYDHKTPIKMIDVPIKKRIVKELFLDSWAQILQILDYQGISCVNYKVRDGKPYLLEINPRVGGSLAEYLFCFVPAILEMQARKRD